MAYVHDAYDFGCALFSPVQSRADHYIGQYWPLTDIQVLVCMLSILARYQLI